MTNGTQSATYQRQSMRLMSQRRRTRLNGWITHQCGCLVTFSTHPASNTCTFSIAMGSPKVRM